MSKEQLTLEQKVDKILAYQKTATHLAWVRGIISILLFLIFVVLPLIGAYYLADYIKQNITPEFIRSKINTYVPGAGSLEQLKGFVNQMEGKKNP